MENSQSQQASTTPSVATSNVRKHYTSDDVDKIRPTTRKGDVWSNFELCIMKDGNEGRVARNVGIFIAPGLTLHLGVI